MCDNLEAEKEEEEKRNESLQTERDLLLAKTELLEKEKIEVENRLVSLQTERKIEQKKQESEQVELPEQFIFDNYFIDSAVRMSDLSTLHIYRND